MREYQRSAAEWARLLPRFTAASDLREQQTTVWRGEAERALAEGVNVGRQFKAEPADLRGIPVIGYGIGGASPGTSPESVINRLSRVPMVGFA